MKKRQTFTKAKAILVLAIASLILYMSEPTVFAAGTYNGGTGEPNSPYRIATAEDLNDIGDHPEDWSKHFILVNDISMVGYTYTTAVITTDTDNSNYDFDGTSFTGTFDGNDHIVSNLTIDSAGTGNDYLGLFGQIGPLAEVRNLGIEDVNIRGDNQSYCLGGLSGGNERGTISNCHATGFVTGGKHCGGIVGANGWRLRNPGGIITNCYAAGSVTGGYGSSHLGGLAGENYHGTIVNCYAIGTVAGKHSHLGGLVGENDYGTISNCYATSNVSSDSGGFCIGGLAGNLHYGTVSNCYVTGTVTVGESSQWIGGLAGRNDRGSVNSCYSTASVSGMRSSGEYGGLIGWNVGTIINCYATGFVTGGNYSANLGGVTGWNDGSISDCYSTGSVTSGSFSGHLGGLVGVNNVGTISNCFWDIETSGISTSDGGTGKTTLV